MIWKLNTHLWLIILVIFPLIALMFSITLGIASAQQSSTSYLDRRVEIWGLFYRGMVGSFCCGSASARKYNICSMEV